jgi:hypothetical protein
LREPKDSETLRWMICTPPSMTPDFAKDREKK